MTDDEIPTVLAEDLLEFNGVRVRVCVLSNGKRIIPLNEAKRVLSSLGLDLNVLTDAALVSTRPKD